MKVLLSAYACQPGSGSEPGKGWLFAESLARQGCEVTVLTCGSHHRKVIEAYLADHDLPANLKFVWHDVPGWSGPGYSNTRHIRQHYMAWQVTARRKVRKLLKDQKFDVIHHLTWTVLRWPSFLGGLGPRFVFGPVGGGETSPLRLRAAFPPAGQRREKLRDVINFVSRLDPLVRGCLRAADVILVTDPATRAHVPARHRDKTHIIADIFAPEPQQVEWRADPLQDGPALLFAGRLEYWKGAHLAIMALAELRARLPAARLTIAGTGPEDQALRDLARQLGVADAVRFAGMVPGPQMPRLYAAHDLFVFPSLHDSGPHVIGEALSVGLPVVCLDLGGPGIAVDASCGAVVATGGLDSSELSLLIAEAIDDLVGDPARLIELRHGAQARAGRFSPEARVHDMIQRFYLPDTTEPAAAAANV